MSGCWIFEPPTTDEAPFLWEIPLDRYRMLRGISIAEVATNVFQEGRFFSYTDENAILNAGLRFYRGGYQWRVSDQDRLDLINSGLVGPDNFTPCPDVPPPDLGFGQGGFGQGPFGG